MTAERRHRLGAGACALMAVGRSVEQPQTPHGLVLHLGAPATTDILDRPSEAGGRRVTARNPYGE